MQSHSVPELSVSARFAPSATAAACAEVICVLVLLGEPGAEVDVPDSEVSALGAMSEEPRPALHALRRSADDTAIRRALVPPRVVTTSRVAS
jgi:hypothetical protein